MAKPIRLEIPPRDLHAPLVERLRAAPDDHAEALLATYEVLQGLHDSGVLELLRGVLGSGDKLAGLAVDAANAPGSTRAVRNLLLLADTLATIEPALLSDITRAIPMALKQSSDEEARPPGLLKLLSTFLNKDFRRGLAVANDLFVAFGRNLSERERRR